MASSPYKFRASNMERVEACEGSHDFEAQLPEPPPQQWTLDGTLAHQLAYQCLSEGNTDAMFYVGYGLEPDIRAPKVTEAIAKGVQRYLNNVWETFERGDYLYVEELSGAVQVGPDLGGTTDCAILKVEKHELHIKDYKNGFALVEVENNLQLLTYALGMVEKLRDHPIERIFFTIIQPNGFHPRGPVREWDTDKLGLFDAVQRLKMAIAKAVPGAPRRPGPHCQFCKGKLLVACPELRDRATGVVEGFKKIAGAKRGQPKVASPELAPEEAGVRWRDIPLLRMYLTALEDLTDYKAQDPAWRKAAGLKYVDNKRKRTYKDGAEASLRMFFDEAQLYEPAKFRSPNQLEEALGPTDYTVAAQFIDKKSSGVTLAPIEDDRPEARPIGAAAAAGFSVIVNKTKEASHG